MAGGVEHLPARANRPRPRRGPGADKVPVAHGHAVRELPAGLVYSIRPPLQTGCCPGPTGAVGPFPARRLCLVNDPQSHRPAPSHRGAYAAASQAPGALSIRPPASAGDHRQSCPPLCPAGTTAPQPPEIHPAQPLLLPHLFRAGDL